MNALKLCIYITLGLLAIFVIYHIIMAAFDRHLDKTNPVPKRLNTPWARQFYKRPRSYERILFENGLLIGLGLMAVITGYYAYQYEIHGAFLDDSWKYPDVAEHFYFETADSDYLSKMYDSDPENFDFDAWDVVLVKFGCGECEMAEQTIKRYADDGYLLIFSKSTAGKAFIDHYGINNVPCNVTNGQVTYYELSGINSDYGDTIPVE